MAEVRISELPSLTTPEESDTAIILDQSAGATKRSTLADMRRALRSVVTSTAAPTAGDDSADGYSIGSLWVRTTTGEMWLCTDATVGVAWWRPVITSENHFLFDNALQVRPEHSGTGSNRYAEVLLGANADQDIGPVSVYVSEVAPSGQISAPPGSLCLVRYPAPNASDGLWIKSTGTGDSGWTQVGAGAGTGDVVGPASSADNEVPRFDTTTGKLVQTSGVRITDGRVIEPITAGDSLTVAGGDTTANAASGGDVLVEGGGTAGTTAFAGNATLRGGASAAGSSFGGNAVVDAGAGGGGAGSVEIGATNAAAITIGRTGITTTIAGTLSAAVATPGVSGLAPVSTPITESGTTRTLSDADHGRTILCTHASGCAVTVPHTLTAGFTCTLVQRGGASAFVTAAGSGGLTVTPPAAFAASTAQNASPMTLYVESATVGLCWGDLDPV